MVANATRNETGPPVLRTGHLLAFASFFSQKGGAVDPLLREHNLPVLCNEPDYFVPVPNLWTFFDAAARKVNPDFGWLVGKYAGDQNLNHGLLHKLEHAPSLYLALKWLVQNVREEASDLQLGIHERTDDVLLFTHYPQHSDLTGYDQSQAYQLSLFIDLIRFFLGKRWSPYEIGIQSQRYPTEMSSIFPNCRVNTDQYVAYVAVPRNGLHRAVFPPEEQPQTEGEPEEKCDFRFAGKLRAVIQSYLCDGYPSASLAAEIMGISGRTLARRLAGAGLTYGDLMDDLRFNMAKTLLLNSDHKIGEIAFAVGFQDQANFNRMFRRIAGVNPKKFRDVTRLEQS